MCPCVIKTFLRAGFQRALSLRGQGDDGGSAENSNRPNTSIMYPVEAGFIEDLKAVTMSSRSVPIKRNLSL